MADTNFTVADLCILVTVSQIEAYEFDLGPYTRIRNWLQKSKEELAPYGYEVNNPQTIRVYFYFINYILFFKEINQKGADILAGMFRAKLKLTK